MFGGAQPNIGVQRAFAWSGIVMLVLFLLGFWVVAGYVPPSGPRESVGQIVRFTGPLDWRGLIAWWLLLVAFGIWVVVLVYTLLVHAIPHHEREAAGSAALPVGEPAPVGTTGALT